MNSTLSEMNVKKTFSEIRAGFENKRQEISSRKEVFPLLEAKNRFSRIICLRREKEIFDDLKKDKKDFVAKKNSMHMINSIQNSSFFGIVKLFLDQPMLFLMVISMKKDGQVSAEDKEKRYEEAISLIDRESTETRERMLTLYRNLLVPEGTQRPKNQIIDSLDLNGFSVLKLSGRLMGSEYDRRACQRKISRLEMRMDKLLIDHSEWRSLYQEIEKNPKLYRELNPMIKSGASEEIQIKKKWCIDENKDIILKKYDAKPLISSGLISKEILEIIEELKPLKQEMDELIHKTNHLLWHMNQT